MEITMSKVVGSSQVSEYGYDAEAKRLRIKFNSGTYDYLDVPPELVASMDDCCASGCSIGKFIAANIKNKFSYQALEVRHDTQATS